MERIAPQINEEVKPEIGKHFGPDPRHPLRKWYLIEFSSYRYIESRLNAVPNFPLRDICGLAMSYGECMRCPDLASSSYLGVPQNWSFIRDPFHNKYLLSL